MEKQGLVSRSIIKNLIRDAISGMDMSYAPYSQFKVGAALLTRKNNTYIGCNVENASFSATNCAERTAIYKAVSEGEKEFIAIAIAGGAAGVLTDYCPPCGVCRQALREFVDPKKFIVILAKTTEDYSVYFLEELLPLSFGPDNLNKY